MNIKKHISAKAILVLALASIFFSCNTKNETSTSASDNDSVTVNTIDTSANTNSAVGTIPEPQGTDINMATNWGTNNSDSVKIVEDIIKYVKDGYRIKCLGTFGDFDQDGDIDYLIIVQNTDLENFVPNPYYESDDENNSDYDEEKDSNDKRKDWDLNDYLNDKSLLDRNPRGYLVVMNRHNNYEITSYNYDCFPSENEEGGVYFAPELSIEYHKTAHRLKVSYSHGRYGDWAYEFRYNDGDFELVREYSNSSSSWIADYTDRKIIDYETGIVWNESLENAEEVADNDSVAPKYKTSEEKIESGVGHLIKMSEKKRWE